MKPQLESLLSTAVQTLIDAGTLPADTRPDIQITRSKDRQHGDYASNVALTLAKAAKTPPRTLAEQLLTAIPACNALAKAEIAGPGFINFFVAQDNATDTVEKILVAGESYGKSQSGQGRRIQVEFVSANPTGPLHVGHGRGAAYGATLANLLEAVGYEVEREYYVNDAGRQMDILATSVWLRYLELGGEEFDFPANGYKGDYIFDIGADLRNREGNRLHRTATQVFADAPADEPAGGDKEAHIDALINNAKVQLGDTDYRLVHTLALEVILDDIRNDLEKFGVSFNRFFSERSLMESGEIEQALQRLDDAGYLYKKGNAQWFRSTDFGDEKDRVVKRDNGQTTYFASDIAYALNKFSRGFDTAIYVWGADHHGYVTRVKAAASALGKDVTNIEIPLVQFAVLYKDKQKVQMSTRSGEFVTLRQLREDVGADAARFFYVMRRCDQHLDFDLDLALSKTNENPMYYIQYAHARICSVMRQLQEKGFSFDKQAGIEQQTLLCSDKEKTLLSALEIFPEVVARAAEQRAPHQLVNYLRELATLFHAWYNAAQFIVDDASLRNARVARCIATRIVIANGLQIIGVSAPESM